MTTEEAAKTLGVSTRRVRTMIAAGELWAKKVGRNWYVSASSVNYRGGLMVLKCSLSK